MAKHTSFVATICKEFSFDAAHHIPTMPDGHKCRGMHGHTYRVEVILRDHVPENGFFVDYGEIALAWLSIHTQLDHKILNDVIPVPTTENLALWIVRELVEHLPQLDRVRVHESSTTFCEVSVMELRAAGVLPLPITRRSITKPLVSKIPEKRK